MDLIAKLRQAAAAEFHEDVCLRVEDYTAAADELERLRALASAVGDALNRDHPANAAPVITARIPASIWNRIRDAHAALAK